MRIAGLSHRLVSVPVPHRIVSSVRNTDHQLFLLVSVWTDEGLVGDAYISAFSPRRARAARELLDELAEVLVGSDASDTASAWLRMWESCRLIGHSGLSAFAISAVDTALWDLKAKARGSPLHALLGSRRSQLPAYASDGCWLEEATLVAAQAERFASEGFSAVKMRFGRHDPESDLRALQAVRLAVGDAVQILVDVNQGWDADRARTYGTRLPDLGVRWLEEPLVSEDVEGLSELRRTLPLDIVAGENAYMPAGARELIERRAVSVLNPDLQRIGGVTGWCRTQALAEERGVPLTAHLFPEVSVHLLAASDRNGPLEWVSWLSPLLEEPVEVRAGMATVPMRPGIGLRFDEAAIRAHEVEQ